MPVVIQEIVITANVDSASPAPTTPTPSSGGAGGVPTDVEARQALVADCVEEVMRMLREKAER